jgi:putative phosphoribosyl transferase
MRFGDRHEAGEILGDAVADLRPASPVVYALPRGGVPVGYEVSRTLHCPLDILIVRKLGVPYQPELAMGAIGEGGIVVRNEEVMARAGIPETVFEEVMARETRELEARSAAYRAVAEPIAPEGHTAVIVDDGLATGSTARVAVSVLRVAAAEEVWLAVPVAPRDTTAELSRLVERVVVIDQPRHFGAVGSWYRDFTQTADEEVRSLLSRSRLA